MILVLFIITQYGGKKEYLNKAKQSNFVNSINRELMSLDMIEKIKHNGNLLAMIIRTQFQKDGIKFFTPDHFSQQLA